MATTLLGHLPDFRKKTFFVGEITFENGIIKSVQAVSKSLIDLPYILPGFIDSHVHIESSMLVPAEFARLAVVHGTVASVSDPHEIANVNGMNGVHFMLENGDQVPFKFYFGAPSCVPATPFESAGAQLDTQAVSQLLHHPRIKYLSEMMNYPGVLQGHPEVLDKIRIAHLLGKPVDGHAPGLRGIDAKKYIDAGISTDHECFTAAEAEEKLKFGMKIIIREGSAAKNFDALIELLHHYPQQIMFCSDDKHPDSLVDGHIDQLCRRALSRGLDIFKVLQAACINPVVHYKLDVGLLNPGDPADFIMVKNLSDFEVHETYINGELVAKSRKSLIERKPCTIINHFNIAPKKIDDIRWYATTNPAERIPVIEALDGQLITNKSEIPCSEVLKRGFFSSNLKKDILKLIVVNRYKSTPIARSFIKNFGIQEGAIASSVAHDSHNIVAVGVDDESLLKAVNLIIRHQGGLSFCTTVHPENDKIIPLPIAGLMSDQDGYQIAAEYAQLDRAVKDAGCKLASPYMTLSFMALLVIPHLKLSDLGLFDGDKFALVCQD